MTNSPDPDNQAQNSNWRLKNLLFSRTSIALGIPLILGLAAGAWWLRSFVYEQLAPLVERNLTQTFQRPVKVGQVERFSLTGLRLGPSSVPATPTDPDRASVEAVEVAFNPLQLIFTRTLKLDVTLINPDIYIQQDREGRWVSTNIASGGEPGPIEIALDKLHWRNADVVLVSNVSEIERPSPQNTVALAQVDGVAQFRENYQLIQFDLDGQLKRGGTLALKGDFRPKTGRTDAQVQTQNFLASDLTRLIKLPLNLQGGRIDSNLKAQLTPEKLTGLYGTADLKSVTAQANQLPQPFVNSQGMLRFQGTKVQLDNVSSSYGRIPAIANGSLDLEGDFNLTARVKAVSAAAAISTLKLQTPVPVSGVFRSDVKLTGPLTQPVLTGTVANIKPVRIDKVNFSKTSTNFTLSTAASTITFPNLQATPTAGGKITGKGSIRLAIKPGQQGGLNFNLVAQNVPGDAIAKAYGLTNPNIKIGLVSAQAQVSGTPNTPRTDVNWQANQATYPGQGKLVIFNAKNILFRDTVFQVASGTVRATGQLVGQRWQASVQASGVRLGQLTQVPPSLQTPVNGAFNFSGTADSFQPQQITATGSGRLTGIGGGTITVPTIQVAAGRWQTQIIASGVQLERLAAVPPQLRGGFTGKLNLSGSTTAFTPETLRGNGQGRLNLAGGTITASNFQLAAGEWQLAVNAAQVQLNRFNQQLRGLLSGQLKLAGTVNAFSLAGIRGAGQLRLSKELLGQPLTAALRWDGQKLIVPQATSPNLQASGVVFVNPDALAIRGLNFNVQLQNYDLQNIPLQLPPAAKIAGRANFTGQITGTLPTPNVVGSLRLQNLVVNNLAFDPVLAGKVQLQEGRGLNLDLTGSQNDRVAVNLKPNFRPNSFLVRRDRAVATGRSEGENLLVNVDNFPLIALNLTPPTVAFGPGPVSGILSADLQVNLEKLAVAGDVAIAQPAIARVQGDRLTAQFRYANGGGTLTSSEFIKGESRYALTGSFNQTPKGPEFQGKANITQGQIQDILAALQIFDIQDFQRGLQPPTYAKANDIGTLEVGLPNAALLSQLRRFSEVQALLQQQRQQRQQGALPLPPLTDLTGTFGGEVSVSGSLQTGVAANFALEGNSWNWGEYNVDQIVAQGSFKDGMLTLLPLRLENAATQVAFTGQIGGKQQSGQLRVRNFPVGMLNKFVQLPIAVTGNLNGTATLAGSTENPQAVGDLQLEQGTLNQNPIESASASFSYANARFSFGSNVMISGPEPLEIAGSIPLQLPFASVKPDSNQIRLDVNVQNQGLALLNVLTNQVAWKGGQGQVNLQVRGTLDQPIATGIASVNNATISAQALPEPLTDVTGRVLFNNDRITVEGIQGNFSQGKVVAQGVIPIFDSFAPSDPDLANPLTVTLDRLALNLQGLYQGGVNGKVAITGSALNPVIGGDVLLANGQVFLPQTASPTIPTATGRATVTNSNNEQETLTKELRDKVDKVDKEETTSPTSPASSGLGGGEMVELNNLRLTLGDRVAVTLPPILDFQAKGTLTVNGTLNELRPDGTIRLLRGSVNLFTTQFTLDRGYEHTATFTPKQNLDPTLDVRLVAAVPEVTRTRIPSSPISSEIADDTAVSAADVGSLQTVRVQAKVEGPASQLFDNLELTSTPSRSQSEIIALIGGGFIQTLGSADTAVGLANIAGTALLSTYQGTFNNIGNALGLSELRIFPTVITNEERSRSSSTLGVAAEGGIDITRNLYFSVLRFLTAADQPTQFGLSYRLSDQIRVRASTDFSGETRALVEYENQF